MMPTVVTWQDRHRIARYFTHLQSGQRLAAYGDLASIDTGQGIAELLTRGKKGRFKRVLSTIALISPFEARNCT